MPLPPKPITLVLIPYAGAAFYAYNSLLPHLPPWVRPLALDLPGHGRRLREPLLKDAQAMADDLWQQTGPARQGPWALFGHSLGAIVAYLLARKVAAQGEQPPAHLFLSGRAGPVLEPEPELMGLPEGQFFAAVAQRYGGVPAEALEHQELMAMFEPILRADFQAALDYRPGPENGGLALPATVFLGRQDRLGCRSPLPWRKVLHGPLTEHGFEGGHFFLLEHWAALGGLIAQALATGQGG